MHVIVANRLVVSLVRAGKLDLARAVFDRGQEMASELTSDPEMLAWMDVANAEIALCRGDVVTNLRLCEGAVSGFVAAGDVRNACLQRCNIGIAYMELGLYAKAERMLRDAIVVGEPMKLNFIGPARTNLGLVLARLGDTEQALDIASSALEQCAQAGHRRYEAVTRLYRAEILRMRGDFAEAEAESRRAIEAAAVAPAARANAMALLADILLECARPREAIDPAREAMGILQSSPGLEAGESLIRLVYALALDAMGQTHLAVEHAREAQRRLLERARLINNPVWRQSFLENIPENARTRALALSGRASKPDLSMLP
jgi:tetratricopeptide (TPR) repeat protein